MITKFLQFKKIYISIFDYSVINLKIKFMNLIEFKMKINCNEYQ